MAKTGFCAISGSGMSALAQVLKFKGHEVYGTDRSFDQNRDQKNKAALQELGIKIYPQDGSMLDEKLDILYASTAVESNIPDIIHAKELNTTIKHRSDLLAETFAAYPYGIAVGGTSGKSTVTAMIGYILDKANYKPLVINGALLKNYEKNKGIPNVILNNGEYCVIEADESDGSIEKYNPYISVINNISLDHKALDELKQIFTNFANHSTYGVIINKDCPNSQNLTIKNKKVLTFGINDSSADFHAKNIKAVPDGTLYTFNGKEYHLNLIGKFNVANAMCAVSCCSLLGISSDLSCTILETFLGTKRRLEVLGTASQITVIDDFAHNPDKVNASMSALKSYKGRLLVMFQPHGFSPMRLMGREIMDSFCRHMDKEDILLVPEIFFAGGTVKRDISSQDLVNHAKEKGANALFYNSRNELKEELLKIARPNDRIVLMGARDNSITKMGFEILERLK